eukprot:6194427-Pleurochrysis_carterae.AAC.2
MQLRELARANAQVRVQVQRKHAQARAHPIELGALSIPRPPARSRAHAHVTPLSSLPEGTQSTGCDAAERQHMLSYTSHNGVSNRRRSRSTAVCV